MKEVEVDSDSEASEDSNKPNDYEKLRDLRVSQNKAKLQALGLTNIASSLFGLGHNKTTPLRRSKRVSKSTKLVDDHDDDDGNDDEYKPNHHDDDDDDDDDYEDDDDNKYVSNSGSNSKKKSADIPDLMDEDEALKQAIALSLNEFGEKPDQQHGGSNQHSRDDNTRKKKSFKNRVQMNEDDMIINFCQFDEMGKGSITLRDLQRMAASHDFTWTDKELADMIRCFDSDRDGKLTLDDFRTIILRCNMLQAPEKS